MQGYYATSCVSFKTYHIEWLIIINALTAHVMAHTLTNGLCDRLSDDGSKAQIGIALEVLKGCVLAEKRQRHVAMHRVTELPQIGHLYSE